MTPRVKVPMRFRNEVVLHLLRCYWLDVSLGTSQILLILGDAGTGKTFQLRCVLDELSVEVYEFNGVHAESPRANEPVQQLAAMFEAVADSIRRGTPSALVIDDADLILGVRQMTQYTHNLQRLTSELMRVAGYVSFGTEALPPATPIFMLANEVAGLHGPLLRAGRTRLFEWSPNRQELAQMVAGLFPELHTEELDTLVESFPTQPIAFFATLRDSLLDSFLLQQLRGRDPREALWEAVAFRHHPSRPVPQYDLSDLLSVGRDLAQARLVRVREEAVGAR